MIPDWMLLVAGVLLLAVKLTGATMYLLAWREGKAGDEPDWRG